MHLLFKICLKCEGFAWVPKIVATSGRKNNIVPEDKCIYLFSDGRCCTMPLTKSPMTIPTTEFQLTKNAIQTDRHGRQRDK